jgi:hypothetical protein
VLNITAANARATSRWPGIFPDYFWNFLNKAAPHRFDRHETTLLWIADRSGVKPASIADNADASSEYPSAGKYIARQPRNCKPQHSSDRMAAAPRNRGEQNHAVRLLMLNR